MQDLQTIEGVRVRGKVVLVRIDADIDLSDDGYVEPGGDHRLLGCLPTVSYLREQGARVVLLGHIGRPEGKVVEALRMKTIADLLTVHIGIHVQYVHDIVGEEAVKAVKALHNKDVLVLENVRFDPREEANDIEFAKQLAHLGSIYVNEAFATAHREHASTAAIMQYLPSYAGFLLQKEVQIAEETMERPDRPLVAVVSGAKVGTKITVLRHLLPRVDNLLVGGGIANMFLQAQGMPVGDSLVEPGMLSEVHMLLQEFGPKILIPTDVRVSRHHDDAHAVVLPAKDVAPGDCIYDVGPETILSYCAIVSGAHTCMWNGPLGRVELPAFQAGTRDFARCVAKSSTYSIVGGGDTVTALHQLGFDDRAFKHVSSGGGALIAFLEEKPLPTVDALRRAQRMQKKNISSA